MSEPRWWRFEIEFVATTGELEAIADAVMDLAADLLGDAEWTASCAPANAPNPECTCGPQPANGQMIRSDCPKHAAGVTWNSVA